MWTSTLRLTAPFSSVISSLRRRVPAKPTAYTRSVSTPHFATKLLMASALALLKP